MKRRKTDKKIEYKHLSRDYARLFQEEEARKGEKRVDEIKARHQQNILINANKIKGTANKTKVYIHKADTIKSIKEIKPRVNYKEIGRFQVDKASDLIEKIRERHHKNINEIINETPILLTPFNYSKSYLFEYGLKRKDITNQIKEGEEIKTFVLYKHDLNRKIDYTKGLLPYEDITEESIDEIKKKFLSAQFLNSTWNIGIKQFSLSFSKEREREEVISGEKHKVIKGRYTTPVRSKVEKKRLYGRSSEINVYKKKEIKDYRDHLQNQKYPMFWRYYKTGFEVLKAMKKEMNSWCQTRNIETKKSHPYLEKIAEDVNLKGYYEKNPDTLKRIWSELNMVKDRLLSERSTTQI